MGYRSEVSIFIEEQENMKLEEIVSKSKEIENYGEFTIGNNSKGKRVLLAYFPFCKWYSYYPLVKFWKELTDKLEELNSNTYLFTRVGEEYGDYETYGEYGWSYPITTCEFDVDFSENIEHIGHNTH